MTPQPLLSIGDFALMTSLPAQTLRYYHRQGLLIPAEIDDETGYRGYTFDQTHRALLIMALRRAGMSIREIQGVLDTPDLLPQALTRHQAALEHQRSRQDSAMAHAWQLAKGWPAADIRDRTATTAIGRQVPGEAPGPDAVVLPQRVRRAAEALQRELRDAGTETAGPPWCQYALRSPGDKAKMAANEGPDWIVAADLHGPGEAPDRLPANTAVLNFPGSRELAVGLPKVPAMPAYAAAVEYLTRTSRERELVPDFSRLRYVLAHDHVELVLAVHPA